MERRTGGDGFWAGLPSGRVSVWRGGPAPAAPSNWRCLHVRCGSGARPLGPVRDALAQAEALLGERLPVADLAAWRVRQGVRRRLLGEEATDEPGVALLVALSRLARELPAEPLAVVFDGVEHADADTLRWLRERVARPGGAASIVVAIGSGEEPAPPLAELMNAAVEGGGRLGRAAARPNHEEPGAVDPTPEPVVVGVLPAEVRLVLRAGAVVGDVFDAAVVARLLDRTSVHVLSLLQEAHDRGVPLTDLGDGLMRLPTPFAAGLRAEVLPSLQDAWRRALVDLIDPPVDPSEVSAALAGMREEADEGGEAGGGEPDEGVCLVQPEGSPPQTSPAWEPPAPDAQRDRPPLAAALPAPFEPIRPGLEEAGAMGSLPRDPAPGWPSTTGASVFAEGAPPSEAPRQPAEEGRGETPGPLEDDEDGPIPTLDDLVPGGPTVLSDAPLAAPATASPAVASTEPLPPSPPPVPAEPTVAVEPSVPADSRPPTAPPPLAEPPAPPGVPPQRGRWRLRETTSPPRTAQRRAPTPESALSAADHLTAIGEAEAAVSRLLEAAARAESVGAIDQATGAARRALALLDHLPGTRDRRRLRADALLRLAGLAWAHGGRVPLGETLRVAEQALRALGDDPADGLRARTRATIAGIAYDIGDAPSLERALTELTEAIRELHAAGDARGAARLLNDQAAVWVRIGDVVRAAHLLEESRRIFSGISQPGPQDQAELAETLHLLACLPLHVGARPGQEQNALDRAAEHAGSAEAVYGRLGLPRERARVWETLGRLAASRGRQDLARTWLARAFEVQLRLGDAVGLARTTEAFAVQLAVSGQLGQALQVLVDSVALNQQLGSPRGLAYNREALSHIARLPAVAAAPAALAALRTVEERIMSAEAGWEQAPRQ